MHASGRGERKWTLHKILCLETIPKKMVRLLPYHVVFLLLLILVSAIIFFNFHGLSFSAVRNHPELKQHHPAIAGDPQKPTKQQQQQQRGKPASSPAAALVVGSDHAADAQATSDGGDDDDDKRGAAKEGTNNKVVLQLEALENVDSCPASAMDLSIGATRHFSLSPPVMSADFLDEMICKANKINKKPYRDIPKKIDSAFCGRHLPECAFWSCLAAKEHKNTSSSSSKKIKDHRDEVSATVALAGLKSVRKCCHEHRALRDTAWWVMRMLEKSNITYFLSTGTALGAVRHHGVIIPWDTDVDMAIFPEDAPRVKALFQAHEHEHFFHKDKLGKKMFWIHASKNGRPADGPHVEIFYEADYTKHREALLPLQRCSFYGRPAWCPNEKMFNVWFPSGWSSYGGAHYHDDGRCTVYLACSGKRVEKQKC